MSVANPAMRGLGDPPTHEPPQPGTSPEIKLTRRKDVDAARVLEQANQPAKWRLLVVVCFPLFFLLAAPYWWYTTSIVRLPLPNERIVALESQRDPPLRTQIWFTVDEAAFPVPPPGKAQFPHNAKVQNVIKLVTDGVDGLVRRDAPEDRGERRWDMEVDAPRAPLRAHILVTDTATNKFPLEPYIAVGDSEDGKVTRGMLVVPVHPDLIGDRNLKQHYKIALINGIHFLFPPHLPGIPTRALAYSPNITLSFVLLNEDAMVGSYVDGWDVEGAIRDHFLPQLSPLSPLFNFFIESQVLYHAPLTIDPDHVNGSWVIDDDGMNVFVSERWSLDSMSSNNPVLRFLLFVPSQLHRPLKLGDSESRASSFLIPQFGSVVILNPPTEQGQGHDDKTAYTLALAALDAPFAQFAAHLRSLLAIAARPSQLHPDPAPGRAALVARGVADPLSVWEMDTVLRTRLAETAAEARKTLAGIVRLVDKIKEMQLGEEVRDKILGAVRRLEGLPAAARARSPLPPSFLLARDALLLANEAFFDPGMMGQLYFPDQHKFAVYTPLFAPVGVSIVVSLLREVKRLKGRRRKAKKEKDQGEGNPKGVVAESESTATSTGVQTRAATRR